MTAPALTRVMAALMAGGADVRFVGGAVRNYVARLNAEINAVLQTPEFRERAAALGAEPAGGASEQFGKRLRDEIALWRRVFAKAGAAKGR